MPIEPWFSVPVFYEQVPGAEALCAEMIPHLRRISEGRLKKQPLVSGDAYSGSNDDTAAQYLFMYKELRPLYQPIVERATWYARQLNLDLSKENLYLGRSWVNILHHGGRIEPHNHMASVFSGAFYLQVPEPDTVLRFTDPKAAVRKDPLYVGETTPYNLGYVDYKVAVGSLLLFPGYLTHGMIAPNRSTEDRISLSFDYYSVSLSGQSAPPPPRSLVDKLWRRLEDDVERS